MTMQLTFRNATRLLTALVLTSLGIARAQDSNLSLPRLFSDNMVLQRNASVPIWGWGHDGDVITVSVQGQTATAIVKYGVWMARLNGLKAGGPYTFNVTSSSHGNIAFKNVFVGEVWLASGQSNMEFPLKRADGGSNDIATSANSMIHLLHVPKARLTSPTNDIKESWTECTPETTPNFSAVEYYFGRDLQNHLKVPIGLIESDWGGTPIESWMQKNYLRAIPEYRINVLSAWNIAQDGYERASARYQKQKKAAKEAGTEFKAAAPKKPWAPSELYNGMISPLAGYAMAGALWYQGEANSKSAEDADEYHRLLPDLIRDWRMVWKEGDFPFLIVQLAPFHPIEAQPKESDWASVREAQLNATKILPNVGLAVTTDVGNPDNIHPTKKQPVGERLALAARGIAYHEMIEYSGPTLKMAQTNENEMVLTFNHVADGLISSNGPLSGFSICGADRKFVWALAEIKGKNQILVHSDLVDHPVGVRYGWAGSPIVNLWNTAGLPASPFRTDDFGTVTPPAIAPIVMKATPTNAVVK